jgi:hypothetical protein
LSRHSDERSSVLSVVERMGRRGFMGKLAMAAMGLATALAGLPQTAEATAGTIPVGCCNLCHNSTGGCSGHCCWTWACCRPGQHLQRCKECYSPQQRCSGDCPSICSTQTVSPLIC